MNNTKTTNGPVKSNPIPLVEVETLRSSTTVESPPGKGNSESGITTFWRVFGGTILSIVALGFITVCNQFNSSLADLRRDIQLQVETRAEFVKKADLERQITSLWTSLKEIRSSASSVHALDERSKALDLQLERQAKTASEERKEIFSRVEENRKSALEENKDLSKKVDELRKQLDEERKENLRKLDDQRRNTEEERKEMARKLEEKQKWYDAQHKELSAKLQGLAERLATVEGRSILKVPAPPPPSTTEPALKKQS